MCTLCHAFSLLCMCAFVLAVHSVNNKTRGFVCAFNAMSNLELYCRCHGHDLMTFRGLWPHNLTLIEAPVQFSESLNLLTHMWIIFRSFSLPHPVLWVQEKYGKNVLKA